MDKIEEIARAIAASFESGSPDIAKNMRMDWQTWMPEARAAYEVMTRSDGDLADAMIEAGNKAFHKHIVGSVVGLPYDTVVEAIYAAMRDAALTQSSVQPK